MFFSSSFNIFTLASSKPGIFNSVLSFFSDGMYLVRPSTHSEHLLTLSIANNHKIFNIVIRKRDDSKFALGTQKAGEMVSSFLVHCL